MRSWFSFFRLLNLCLERKVNCLIFQGQSTWVSSDWNTPSADEIISTRNLLLVFTSLRDAVYDFLLAQHFHRQPEVKWNGHKKCFIPSSLVLVGKRCLKINKNKNRFKLFKWKFPCLFFFRLNKEKRVYVIDAMCVCNLCTFTFCSRANLMTTCDRHRSST